MWVARFLIVIFTVVSGGLVPTGLVTLEASVNRASNTIGARVNASNALSARPTFFSVAKESIRTSYFYRKKQRRSKGSAS